MGGAVSYYEPGLSDYYEPSAHAISLRNQTFKIKGHSYTLLERIGGGAFGSVWSAVRPDGSPAAVKTIDISGRHSAHFDPVMLMESFKKEIEMAYRMRQETRHVVTIYGFDFDRRTGLALMAMELGGDTLTRRIERFHGIQDMKKRHGGSDGTMAPRGDFIPPQERKDIWVQLVNIVQTLHRHHVIHRDMKPDNLVFFGPIMKIVDLGIAQKEVIGRHHSHAPPIGTQFFSAPECFHKGAHITSKADIWSAGAILYLMTYGQPPMEGSPHPPHGAFPTRSHHVDDVLRHCIRHSPHHRGSHSWLAQHPYTVKSSAL